MTDGRSRHLRRFGKPRTLDPHEQLWLSGEGLPEPAEVAVNGHILGSVEVAHMPFAFRITQALQARNELVVTLAGEGSIGELTLVIREETD